MNLSPYTRHLGLIRKKTRYSRWIILACVSTGAFLASLDSSIVNIALPTLVRELNAEFAAVQWVVLSYMLAVVLLILPIGHMGDILGKKKIYLAGFVAFTMGSALCGSAVSLHGLVAFRLVQGIGAAMIMALGFAIVTQAFPRQERGKAIGILSSIVALAIALGPVVGGFLIEYLAWQWIFFVNVPVGIFGSFMVYAHVPDIASEKSETRSAHLLLDTSLFSERRFTINLVTGFVCFVAYAGAILILPFFLEDLAGYTTRESGLFMAIIPLMLGLVSPVAGSMADRFGEESVTIAGMLFFLLALHGACSLDSSTSLPGIVVRLASLGAGMGMFMSPNNSAIMGSVPTRQLGIASGMLTAARTLGQTLGVAAAGTFWTFRILAHSKALPMADDQARISGLYDTFTGLFFLVAAGLVLALWSCCMKPGSGR